MSRRTDEPPRHRCQELVDGISATVPRRTAGDQSRSRVVGRGDHQGAAPRSFLGAGHWSHRRVQGHLHPVCQRPRRGRAPADQAGRRTRARDRSHAEVRRSFRSQGDQGGPGPQRREADCPSGVPEGRGAQGDEVDHRAVSRSSGVRPNGDRGDGVVQGLRRARRVRGRRVRSRSRANDCSYWA